MMARYAAVLPALLIFCAFLTVCNSDREARYYCRDEGFSIAFSKEWKIRENIKGTRILAEIPEGQDIPVIKQNVNVVVETVRVPVSIGQYVGIQINGLRKLKGVKIFESGDATVSDVPAKCFTYSYTINDFGYRAVVYALNRGATFYVITGISQCNNFKKYESVFHTTAKSFRFE
jgi:hypothetical protein